jgi:hypothetical protein
MQPVVIPPRFQIGKALPDMNMYKKHRCVGNGKTELSMLY